MSIETAIICRVPEAERYIARYRERYDPSARRNVPAHVTILYPFLPPQDVDAQVLERLREIAAAVPCFDYRMAETRRFPVALYLAPQPDSYFAALTDAVWRAFPDYPPFAGKFATVVPHVTVAHGDEPQLCEIEIELRIALPGAGIPARCSEMVLIENSTGRWEEMQRFALGAS
ncbi:MAG TPA: 2'-5' RNA ligase family protein [Steroidobacteraceae bacterium]|jgi:2'-5' RNA ligase|nr:2'-5' RNA ligase family protein [Steroidobacteraceae bacterium]